MNASNYLENALINHLFGSDDFTPPANLYVALFTAAPSDSGGGTEVAGGSYARANVTNDETNFPNATTGTVSNATPITFAQASAGWGTVTHFGIFDAGSAGNLLVWGALTTPKTVATNDTVSFAAGQLEISLD